MVYLRNGTQIDHNHYEDTIPGPADVDLFLANGSSAFNVSDLYGNVWQCVALRCIGAWAVLSLLYIYLYIYTHTHCTLWLHALACVIATESQPATRTE
eukprot:COSAG03_NODE_499_length_7409_cov_11.656088_10_plen_98_part_00